MNIVLLPVSRKEARIVNSKFFKSGKKCPAGHDSKNTGAVIVTKTLKKQDTTLTT